MQFIRPSADTNFSAWQTETGSTNGLFAVLDEETADDTDFAEQTNGATNSFFEVSLSAPQAAPLVRRGHAVRYRYRKHQAAGNVRGLSVELRQTDQVIAGNTHDDISVVWREGAFALTPEEASLITDYAALRLRFIPSGETAGGVARRRVQVSWAEVRLPDHIPTFENEWGATEDRSTPGVVRYVLDGITGEGATREDALVDLMTKTKDADPTNPVTDRRWNRAYYDKKMMDYTKYRADLISGDAPLAPDMTIDQALASVDEKMDRFRVLVETTDAGDR